MSQLLLFVMAACGFTYIMTDSNIMEPLRNWLEKVLPTKVYEVFTCHQCMGFWTGLICGLTLLDLSVSGGLMGGFAGSFVSMLFGRIILAIKELPEYLLHASLYYESQVQIILSEEDQ